MRTLGKQLKKPARQDLILELVSAYHVHSGASLHHMLTTLGLCVTYVTVMRDIKDLCLYRVTACGSPPYYTYNGYGGGERLPSWCYYARLGTREYYGRHNLDLKRVLNAAYQLHRAWATGDTEQAGELESYFADLGTVWW